MAHSVPILDEKLLARLRELSEGEAPGTLARLIQRYLTTVPPQLERMQRLLIRGDAGTLAEEAHGLAGSSGMYGLSLLRQRCLALEECARRRRLEGAEALLAEVTRAFEEARPLLLARLE